jgi:hypothetical protein
MKCRTFWQTARVCIRSWSTASRRPRKPSYSPSSARNPIRRFGGSGGSSLRLSISSARMVMTDACCSCVLSILSRRAARSACVAKISRSLMNARTIRMLICAARPLLRTDESMATPCPVKAYGGRRKPIRAVELEVTICDLQLSNSSWLSWNIKSSGNRLRLRRTAWLRALVGTWYKSAKSESIITFWFRIRYICCSMRSTGTIVIGDDFSWPF